MIVTPAGYLGDIAVGATIDFLFYTSRFSSGASFTLAGSPAVSVYKNNDTTQSTAGVTLTADYDSVTGLNHVRITTGSDGTFYAASGNYYAVITTGTVDSVSVTGAVVASFSISNRPVQGIGSSVITATSIASDAITAAKIADDAIDAGSIAANAITAAKIADGAIDAGSIATGAITAAKFAAGAIDAAATAADFLAEINAEVVDALATDTYAEPSQGSPGATLSLSAKINYLYKAWRNKKTQTATTWSLYNDDESTVDHKSTVADDGTTASRSEVTTGP